MQVLYLEHQWKSSSKIIHKRCSSLMTRTYVYNQCQIDFFLSNVMQPSLLLKMEYNSFQKGISSWQARSQGGGGWFGGNLPFQSSFHLLLENFWLRRCLMVFKKGLNWNNRGCFVNALFCNHDAEKSILCNMETKWDCE